MSKTFREVIRDIKHNETYVCHVKGVGNIEINYNKDNSIIISTPYGDTKIKSFYEFEKVRNEVPFDVAFKEILNGKEIESCYSGYKYKLIDGIYYVRLCADSKWERTVNIQINEIKNDWFIND